MSADDDAGPTSDALRGRGKPPPMPTWVKVLIIVLLVLVGLMLAAHLLLGGGPGKHGPGKHASAHRAEGPALLDRPGGDGFDHPGARLAALWVAPVPA